MVDNFNTLESQLLHYCLLSNLNSTILPAHVVFALLVQACSYQDIFLSTHIQRKLNFKTTSFNVMIQFLHNTYIHVHHQ